LNNDGCSLDCVQGSIPCLTVVLNILLTLLQGERK